MKDKKNIGRRSGGVFTEQDLDDKVHDIKEEPNKPNIPDPDDLVHSGIHQDVSAGHEIDVDDTLHQPETTDDDI